jgi:hypothetical protein
MIKTCDLVTFSETRSSSTIFRRLTDFLRLPDAIDIRLRAEVVALVMSFEATVAIPEDLLPKSESRALRSIESDLDLCLNAPLDEISRKSEFPSMPASSAGEYRCPESRATGAVTPRATVSQKARTLCRFSSASSMARDYFMIIVNIFALIGTLPRSKTSNNTTSNILLRSILSTFIILLIKGLMEMTVSSKKSKNRKLG